MSPQSAASNVAMTLPLFIDRPFRRFMKRLPRSSKHLRYLLFLPVLFFLYRQTTHNTLSLAYATRTTASGTTVISPCTPHTCKSPLSPAQILNLHAALANTAFLHLHTVCNTSASLLDPSETRVFTTATSILLPRDSFLKVGGFDERIPSPVLTTLITRLSELGLKHIALTTPSAEATVYKYIPFPKWTARQASIYTKAPLTLTFSPPLHNISGVIQTARRRALHDVHHLPWELLNRLQDAALHSLITSLDKHNKLLLIHVAHGLGNRLRALGSSLAFAKATNRVPVLIWSADAHCAVHFDQLFKQTDFPVIKELPGYPFRDAAFYDYTWSHWDVYNYMPGEGIKDERIVDGSRHIYYKGAYVVRTPHTSWDAANEHLRALVPVKAVREKVDAITQRLQRSVCVHVRHLSTERDIGGVDPVGEYGDFDTRVIGYFRSICSPRTFVDELRKVLPEKGLSEVFVATDSPQWRADISKEIDGVWGIDCVGRCEVVALVDLLALARCPTVLGSFWSSFSEAVQRFSGRKIRLAGVDFGNTGAEFGKDVEDYVRDIIEKRRAAGK